MVLEEVPVVALEVELEKVEVLAVVSVVDLVVAPVEAVAEAEAVEEEVLVAGLAEEQEAGLVQEVDLAVVELDTTRALRTLHA